MFIMLSRCRPVCGRAVVGVFILFGIVELVLAETPVNLIRNGNFETLVGYFPAGVLVTSSSSQNQVSVIPHWYVQEGAPVEIISSLLHQSSTSAKSRYAMHLNTRAGAGGIQTMVPFAGVTKYRLSFDVAGNPSGGSSVKRLEVDVSPIECRPKQLSFRVEQGANWKRLNWKTVHLVFEVHPRKPKMMLKFRSLTPGAYGPLIDNVRLIPLHADVDSHYAYNDSVSQHLDFCTGDDKEAGDKSAIELLVERVWMTTETWIRQRFLRRADW